GLIPKIQKSMLSKDRDSMQPHIRAFVDRAVTFIVCPDCEGTRLAEHARTSLIDGRSIADVCAMQISDLAGWVSRLRREHTSARESQRTRMIRHLGSALTDVTYVFDEPTIGLHPHDIATMNSLLEDLRDKGNTVLVVEHEPETIAIADHVVDLGPRAGADGGT